MNLEKQVYHYAMQKIQTPYTDNITFFEQLDATSLPENEPLYLCKQYAPQNLFKDGHSQRIHI
jgi:hypothetical protein